MPIKFLDRTTFLIQIQRDGVRRTKRGTGTESDAKRQEEQMLADLAHEQKLDEAARVLGVDRTDSTVAGPVPTLRAFFESRWIEHARVVQIQSTRRAQRTAFQYLIFYLGDRPLADLLRPSEINAFVETMKTNGPMMFAIRKDGKPWRRRVDEFTNETLNKALQCLKALLNLAHAEGVIPTQPKIDLLPSDDSQPVLPPTEEQFQKLLAACDDYVERAPLLPELVEFLAETGLRRGEAFNLSWKSVELVHDAIRIERQGKTRIVNGRVWRPKHNKHRIVPLSSRAKAILEQLVAGRPKPDDLVFPNRSGAPFERVDGAPKGSGHGWFPDAVEAAGLKGVVTMHSLRHFFAVRLLTKGVAITIVSELLGHSDINLTVKRYGRYASDAKVKFDAIRVLDAPAVTPPAPVSPTAQPAAPERKLVAIDGGRGAGDKAARPAVRTRKARGTVGCP